LVFWFSASCCVALFNGGGFTIPKALKKFFFWNGALSHGLHCFFRRRHPGDAIKFPSRPAVCIPNPAMQCFFIVHRTSHNSLHLHIPPYKQQLKSLDLDEPRCAQKPSRLQKKSKIHPSPMLSHGGHGILDLRHKE